MMITRNVWTRTRNILLYKTCGARINGAFSRRVFAEELNGRVELNNESRT